MFEEYTKEVWRILQKNLMEVEMKLPKFVGKKNFLNIEKLVESLNKSYKILKEDKKLARNFNKMCEKF